MLRFLTSWDMYLSDSKADTVCVSRVPSLSLPPCSHGEGHLRGRDLTDKCHASSSLLPVRIQQDRVRVEFGVNESGAVLAEAVWHSGARTLWGMEVLLHRCICTSPLSLWLWVSSPAPAFIPFPPRLMKPSCFASCLCVSSPARSQRLSPVYSAFFALFQPHSCNRGGFV